MIQITINSKQINLQDDISISKYLQLQGYNTDKIAIEADGEILPRLKWNETKISEFNKYEIVEFVGGG
ncbi:hypothetical protein LMG7974_00610 [Campylobacter majalis]|uniref:Sulfur carrier protein ThiS n=1 Tax=Campylobacter majalis TaxID=2790656 RepID=A0ABM8Q4B3_9BACT|nr:sulfur carrier protein ThiS [Campylobacter majalis]CAD7287729.1 hypothetical protein LMG7974_00610 [Campylobacter majalis]